MTEITTMLNRVSAAIPDGSRKLFAALILFVCIDYITGLCVAIRERKVSSKIGAKGLARKIAIFALVALGAIIDLLLIGEGSTLCSVTILFYCSNELISICENANKMGIPLPKKLVAFLEDFQKRQNQS